MAILNGTPRKSTQRSKYGALHSQGKLGVILCMVLMSRIGLHNNCMSSKVNKVVCYVSA